MDIVYIFGHRNPDTDAICSAIAYAHLKNRQSSGFVAARLGEPNRETRWVLEQFGVALPPLIPHVHLRAQDVMTEDVICATVDATVHEVGQLMRDHEIHAIPIVDEAFRVQGVITERSLMQHYLQEVDVQGLQSTPTALGKIAATLDATILVGDPATQIQGNAVIGAMSPATMPRFIAPDDLVILGNRENAQAVALLCNISCLVTTGGFVPPDTVQELARERGAAILVTPHPTFGAARRINLSVPARTWLEPDVIMLSPDSLVSEFTPDLLASKHGVALVQDEGGRLVGILTKSDLVKRRRRRVILVDHSEKSQSADGIERADILEILDHHRLGGLETAGPILAMIAPVGCTATLVFRRYRELGEEPPRAMAGLMLAALLSDTMLLKSPTTTPEDAAVVQQLGALLGEDPLAFGTRMYNAKFDIGRLAAADIAANDLKLFSFGEATVAIGQIEVGDMVPLLARKADILAAMAERQEAQGYDLMLLMVTDVGREGTELLTVGRTRAVERAFGIELHDGSVYLPGVLSRKKQIVPPLAGVM